MKQLATKIGTDIHGNPAMVPATATEFQVMKLQAPGDPGRPSFVSRKRKRLKYPIGVDIDTIMADLPSGRYRFDAINAQGERVGEGIEVILEHIDDEPAPEASAEAGQTTQAEMYLREVISELRDVNRELRGIVEKVVDKLGQSYEVAVKAQVEMTKNVPGVVEAAARMLEAAQGGGLSKAADEIRQIWENAPENGNQLETVLNSPVVIGAAAALQKYMAQAAENGAQIVASNNNGPRKESMAQRAARLAAAANDRAAREGRA